MINNFPKAPDGLCFEIREAGLGWLSIQLKNKKTHQVLLSKIVERPNITLFNIPGKHTLDLEEIKNYEVSQEKEIVASAHELLKKYTEMFDIDEELSKNIREICDFNKEHYIGRY